MSLILCRQKPVSTSFLHRTAGRPYRIVAGAVLCHLLKSASGGWFVDDRLIELSRSRLDFVSGPANWSGSGREPGRAADRDSAGVLLLYGKGDFGIPRS